MVSLFGNTDKAIQEDLKAKISKMEQCKDKYPEDDGDCTKTMPECKESSVLARADESVKHTQALADTVLKRSIAIVSLVTSTDIPNPDTCEAMSYSNRIQKISADLSGVGATLQESIKLLDNMIELVE